MMLAPPPRHMTDLDFGLRSGSVLTQRRMMSDVDVRAVPVDASPAALDQHEFERAARAWAIGIIAPLRLLPENWDSYGAYPLDEDAAEIGVTVLSWIAMLPLPLPLPHVFPTADGGLSVESHSPDFDLVLSLTPPNDEPPSAYIRSGGDEWEIEDLRVPDGRLDAALSALAGARSAGV